MKVVNEIESPFITLDSEDKKEDLKHDHNQAEEMIFQWKSHIIRAENQERAKQNALKTVQSNAALIFMDWAMKFIQLKYREKQSEWFGKRGINWHVSSIITRSAEDNGLRSCHMFICLTAAPKTGTHFAQFWNTFLATSNRASLP